MLFTLARQKNLKQYNVMDELRNQLKTMNRQFGFHKTAMKNNLIGILDQTYPGVNTYFDSPAVTAESNTGCTVSVKCP